jgi:hypothetical protein
MAAISGALVACHHSAGSSGVTLVKRHAGPGAGTAHGEPADSGPADLVAAVSPAGREEGPVSLKFQVIQRPVAGQPVVMTLRLVANQALDHLEARFLPDDGLAISDGGDFDPAGHLDSGATLDHNLTVLPAHDGVYTVMATVTTGTTAAATSRSFVIPIVVASPDAPAAKPR